MGNADLRVRSLIDNIQAGKIDRARLVLDIKELTVAELRQLGRAASIRTETPHPLMEWPEIVSLVRQELNARA
jgi:hypothetical protein